MGKKPIAITMGDPAGVGPEVCLHLLNHPELAGGCVVFGDSEILRQTSQKTGIQFNATATDSWSDLSNQTDKPSVVHVEGLNSEGFTPGTISAHTGKAGFAYVNAAIDAALAGEVAAVATAPLNKEAMRMGGIQFPGHTEIFAHRTESKRWCMMQYSEEITCTFVTVHVGYAEVPKLLTTERILEVIELSAEALERIRQKKPLIGVCGLNPHAGEHGLFGDSEEERIIIPAIEAARKKGINVEGPIPPDTAFLPWKRKSTDAFVCMYHDQGHIPVKALAFDCAVNTTVGLPIVRTSVDHGTALDIAWQGKAKPDSLFSAVRLAQKLSG